jgi:hypothetical protein
MPIGILLNEGKPGALARVPPFRRRNIYLKQKVVSAQRLCCDLQPFVAEFCRNVGVLEAAQFLLTSIRRLGLQ